MTFRNILTLGVLLSWLPVVEARGEPGERPELWFPVGEELTYRIYWGLIPVGTTKVKTQWDEHEGRKVLAIRVRTRSNRWLDLIYPVDDFLESLIDPETFLPIRFTKRLNEGTYHCDEVTHFDREKGVASWYSRLQDRTKEYAIKEDTRDLISFMYFMRNRSKSFEPGVVERFKVMADEKLYDLYVEPKARDTVKLPNYGKVESVVFEPEAAFEGLFVRKGKLWIWVSDDERRILTAAAAKIPVASIKIKLAKVAGPGDDFWIRNAKTDGEEEEGHDDQT